MECVYEGVFEGIDNFGRIIIYHNNYTNNHYDWFIWKKKIIGKPDLNFIGRRNDQLALPEDFQFGDKVKFRFIIKKFKDKRYISIKSLELIK